MVEYWQCGNEEFDLDEFVDKNVGEALKSYVEEDGILLIDWDEEPSVNFSTGPDCEFQYKESLYKILLREVGMYRRDGDDNEDLFYDPEGDRRVILMQELLRTYLKWKEGGVHQPSKEESSDE